MDLCFRGVVSDFGMVVYGVFCIDVVKVLINCVFFLGLLIVMCR